MTTFLPTTRLSWTGMHLTRAGFGACAIGGGGWAYAQGNQDDAAFIAAIRHAVESGINWLDTAAVYGWDTPKRSWRPARRSPRRRDSTGAKGGRVSGRSRRSAVRPRRRPDRPDPAARPSIRSCPPVGRPLPSYPTLLRILHSARLRHFCHHRLGLAIDYTPRHQDDQGRPSSRL
jgi:hypothetical protein